MSNRLSVSPRIYPAWHFIEFSFSSQPDLHSTLESFTCTHHSIFQSDSLNYATKVNKQTEHLSIHPAISLSMHPWTVIHASIHLTIPIVSTYTVPDLDMVVCAHSADAFTTRETFIFACPCQGLVDNRTGAGASGTPHHTAPGSLPGLHVSIH